MARSNFGGGSDSRSGVHRWPGRRDHLRSPRLHRQRDQHRLRPSEHRQPVRLPPRGRRACLLGPLLRQPAAKDSDWLVILTAGHCVAAYLDGLQSGALADVGVSFDALIERPVQAQSVWPPDQYILGGQPVLPREYGPQGLNAFNLQFDYAVIVFRRSGHTGAPARARRSPSRPRNPGAGRLRRDHRQPLPAATAAHRRRLWYGRGAQQAGRGRQ